MEIENKKKYHYNRKSLDLIVYNKSKLIDIISCPICLDKYKHPRNLVCGHPFCTTCLHMININNEITCPMCRNITKFSKNNLLIDLPINATLVSIIDESHSTINTTNINLKLRRSKSVDSFTSFKRNVIKRNIFYNEIIKPDINNTDGDYIVECERECCSFQ